MDREERRMTDWICKEVHADNGGYFEPVAEMIRCKECKHSEPWYRDRRRCFLWDDGGVSVWDDGFCNYAEREEE